MSAVPSVNLTRCVDGECIEEEAGVGGIKGGRMAPVAPTLHQCTYLTPGQRMEKKWQKFFCWRRRRSQFFFSFLTVYLTWKSWKKKSPLPPLQQGGHVSTAAPSLSSLAVWMSAVFVMTRVQSGGKLEPRRTGNWQIVFCPARIIISNTQRLHAQRTSAANSVTRNLKDTPFITPASPNFTLSGILSDTRHESEKTPAAVSNRHQTCAVFLVFFDCVLSRKWCITAQKMQMKFSLQLQWENTRHLKDSHKSPTLSILLETNDGVHAEHHQIADTVSFSHFKWFSVSSAAFSFRVIPNIWKR